MKESEKVKIREVLYNNYEFSECILEELNWLNYGSSIELKVDYVWSDSNGFHIDSEGRHCINEGKLREHLDKPFLRIIRFNFVQELLLKNFLPTKTKQEIDNLNLGFSEIETVRIEDNNLFLSYYLKEPIEYHHVYISFGNKRRLDIICNEVEILEQN